MSFFTSQQLFGNGAGVPGDAGWVPIDVSAPPTFSANNRGIAFGEQLTSSIANRPHYALALNDDDLNTRLALFETGGLDAAYDQGALAVDGGGRLIDKDGGAVETVSTLGAQYIDDAANAHFRANTVGDTLGGGGGYDFKAQAAPILPSALYGYMDRRTRYWSGDTTLTATVSATLNPGGGAPAGVLLGAGFYHTAGDTDLMVGIDMIEVTGGDDPGLYVITAFASATQATVRSLDGQSPSFSANDAVTIRVYRPTFASLNPSGHSGLLTALQGTVFTGLPGQDAAVVFAPGAVDGTYSTTSPDGAKNAWRVLRRGAAGAMTTQAEMSALGKLSSYAASAHMPDASYDLGANFGLAGYFIQQDDDTTHGHEAGFVARSNGDLVSHLGVVVANDVRTTADPTGVVGFDFINIGAQNVETDIAFADLYLHPTMSFVEIITPAAQAGVYRVDDREANNGRLILTALGGETVSLPTSGAGTLRALHGATLGHRQIFASSGFQTGLSRVSAVMTAPGADDSAALALACSDGLDQAFLRGFVTEDGGTGEAFRAAPAGTMARRFGASSADGFYYTSPPSRNFVVSLGDWHPTRPSDVAAWQMNGVSGFTSATSLANSGLLYVPLNSYLRRGMVITNVEVIVMPGASRTGSDRVRVRLSYRTPDFGTPASNPISENNVANDFDNGATTAAHIIRLDTSPNGGTNLGGGHTVAQGRDYVITITAGNTGAASADTIYAIRITYNDPGPINM